MGKSKQSSSGGGSLSQTTVYTPTPEEQEFNKLQLQQYKQLYPQETEANKAALETSSNLLGGKPLPGPYSGLYGGISDSMAGDIAQKAIKDLQPQFAASGLLDSGVNAAISGRTAGDIRRQVAQYNVENLKQLLGMGFTGAYQGGGQALQLGQQIGGQLAGLRTVNQQGTNSFFGQSTYQQPFGQTFQQMASPFSQVLAGRWCWIAAEIFGGWEHPKTCAARKFIGEDAPEWFKNIYIKFGEQFAKFISDKKWLKNLIRPIFEYFARRGGYGN